MAFAQDQVPVAETDATIHEIVTSIAEQTGTDVLDLPPLNDSIDTDALTSFLQSEASSGLEFAYDGRTVNVDANGRVRVTDGV